MENKEKNGGTPFAKSKEVVIEEQEYVLFICISKHTVHTFAFSMQGQMAHAALACTSGLGFFSKDQRRRTPSRPSMILREKKQDNLQVVTVIVYITAFSVS